MSETSIEIIKGAVVKYDKMLISYPKHTTIISSLNKVRSKIEENYIAEFCKTIEKSKVLQEKNYPSEALTVLHGLFDIIHNSNKEGFNLMHNAKIKEDTRLIFHKIFKSLLEIECLEDLHKNTIAFDLLNKYSRLLKKNMDINSEDFITTASNKIKNILHTLLKNGKKALIQNKLEEALLSFNKGESFALNNIELTRDFKVLSSIRRLRQEVLIFKKANK